MASSSSAAARPLQLPQWKYDVFISFRGADTRKNFTSHLYEGLRNKGIFTFQDDKRLEHGDLISEELLKAIEESQVTLIVFSRNYAASSWCLNELVKIMDCKKEENGHTVIPVFYDVDPSHVRYQSQSFAEALAKHESKYKGDDEGMQKVQGWRTSLTAAADLKGYDIRQGVESENIQEIVKQILSKCKTSVSYLQDVVGIDTHLEEVKSQLKMEINDVRIVGIWGMGGIGKTTIVRAIFDRLSYQFEATSFIADIKENKAGMHSLQNILLSELLRDKANYVNNKEDGKHMIARRFRFKKVLVVLDDIDHRDHLDYLAGNLNWYGDGSRIIATTRDKHLIEKTDVVYEVTTLVDHQAIKLFNQYAFKQEVPDECFEKLSLEVVSYAKGLPLALKVWGSLLHKRDITEWRSAIGAMKINSKSEIVEKLKVSYDRLENIQQDIFLDIACFLRGENKDYVMSILESCYSGANIELSVLIDKSLVFISEYDTIQMHDLIQDMGKYIVKMQKDPGERSRIWDAEDFKEVMDNNSGTKAMEAIWIDDYVKILSFSKKAMENIKRLRILYIRDFDTHDDSIEYLPNSLRWLECHNYPWESLPEDFEPNRLVHLDLARSSLHYLWIGTKHLPSLRFLHLRCSSRLRRTPDFTGMPNLEYLDLNSCWSLEEVHPSLKCCGKLIRLYLYSCESLKRFPDVNVESLRWLHLGGSGLRRTPDFTGMPNLEYLDLEECRSLEEVHPSLKCCGKLILLNLFNCYSLERFPYVNVESLEHLDLRYCRKLEKFPEFLGRMKPELEIWMAGSGIREIPTSIFQHRPHLIELDLSNMENLVSLPSSICKLKGLVKLDVSYCSKLESLPEEIGDLQNLEELDASNTLISRPPSSIVCLNKLKWLSFEKEKSKHGVYFVFPLVNEGLRSLEELNLSCCNLMDGGLPEDIGCLSSLKELNLSGNNFEHLPRSVAQLGALRSLDLSDCKRLTQLPEFQEQLDRITADWSNDWICNSLFQNISSITEISASDSLSLRVFTSRLAWREDIPSWFHHRGTGTSVSVNLPENWYVHDNFLGFAVCCSGRLIDITAHLIPLCDDGMSSMTQKFALSNHSKVLPDIHFFLMPFAGLWDTSKANGKTPNDYGRITLSFCDVMKVFGFRLLYKDDPELCIGIRRSRYDDSEHHEEDSSTGIETLQLFPTNPGLVG